MGNEINPRLTPEKAYSLIDKNGNGKIDKGDDLELAKMFGLKEGDKKIDPKKVQGYDSKISVFSNVAIKDNSVTVNGNSNETIVIHGNNNEAKISVPENQNATFSPVNGEFSDEAKFALMKKGLDPSQILSAGFGKVVQQVDKNGDTILTLISEKDGYNLKITDPQDNATITRDPNGNLKLDGVVGKLDILPSQSRSHELILSNIYDDDVPTLEINNKSGVPLTRTFPCDEKGNLSFDAGKALWLDKGFPEGEAVHGGFTQVSITDSPGGRSNIHLESSRHGFVLDVDGNSPQPEDMELEYNKSNNRFAMKLLSNANLTITEDGAKEHSIDFSYVNNLNAENKTTKPVHIRESVIKDDKGKLRNDKSSFTYKTETNYDTFEREYRKSLDTNITSGGTLASHRERRGCTCNKERWTATTGASVVGAFNIDIHWGEVVKTARKQSLAPGRFVVEPTAKDYDEYEQTVKLRESNKKNISSITMYDYINTKEAIKENNSGELGLDSKIGRSERNWSGLGIKSTVEDNSVTVNGDKNKTIIVYGDNNIAHIGPDNGQMSAQAHKELYENYHLNTKMLAKAGFNEVDMIKDNNGNVTSIVLTNKDGSKLTLPSDEAMIFSEQMSITKDAKGVYRVSNLVGKFEGKGMKIECPESNFDLTIIEHDPENGYFKYNKHDSDSNTKDAFHLNYSTPEGTEAQVYNVVGDKTYKKTKNGNDKNHIDITYPVDQKGTVRIT